jgi:hypothetical protein
MADSKETLFYVFQNGRNFHIIEMTPAQVQDWNSTDWFIAAENTLKNAIARIKSESVEAIAFTAKCPGLGHRHAAHYWPLGQGDSIERTCPNPGCGHKSLEREDFAD